MEKTIMESQYKLNNNFCLDSVRCAISSVPIWRIVSYFWKYRCIPKHERKCIISHQSFLKLDGICKIELLKNYS